MSATLAPPRRAASEGDDVPFPGQASAPPERTEGHERLWARLAVFGALALLAAAQWSSLVAPDRFLVVWGSPLDLRITDQGGRALLVVVAALAGGWLLARSKALRIPRAAAVAARGVVAVGTLALALIAAGVPFDLLGPSRWSELADGVDRGLAGIRTLRWPYAGGEPWIRLAVLSAAPLALAPAAVLAFWPVTGRRGRDLPWLASAAAPLALYGLAVVELDPGADLRRGAVLFVLLALWLCLPRLERRAVGPGLAALACVAVLAAGVAAASDRDVPLLQYDTWSSNAAATRFEWNHSYGPLDWSRTGATLLQVRSREPHYWKAQTLDRFDGRRWVRSAVLPALAPTDLPDEPNPAWIEELEVTVRGLSSELVVGAGTTYNVSGAGATTVAADGTALALDGPLEEGDSYSVNAYVPDPSAAQMRAAAALPYLEGLSSYTEIALPPEAPVRPGGGAGGELVSGGFRGQPSTAGPGAGERLRASPYGRTYALARRLAPARLSTYDAVKAIERHLQESYEYSERPPRRAIPLDAFLFQDRRGYCQQFSGAMALMLRMNGIPARVATGFSPGSLDRATGEYRVRDLDAHSWVEAFFPGIGWVPFDPTPSVSPAEAQVGTLGSASAARGGSADAGGTGREDGSDGGTSERAADTPAGEAPDADSKSGAARTGTGGLLAVAILALGVVALASIAVSAARARRRAANGATGADPELKELHHALAGLGRAGGPAGVTLTALEQDFTAEGRAGAAAYVRALAERRFAPGGAPRPGRAARRALRRDLSAGGGPVRRLRAFAALPPWGPGAVRGLTRT